MARKKHSWSAWTVIWLSSWGRSSAFSDTVVTELSVQVITEDGEQLLTEGK